MKQKEKHGEGYQEWGHYKDVISQNHKEIERLLKNQTKIYALITHKLADASLYEYPNNFLNWNKLMQSCFYDGVACQRKSETGILIDIANIIEGK
jgi:hypothetical protein